MPRSRKLEELSWPEVRDALADGYTTVVVAAGLDRAGGGRRDGTCRTCRC